MRNSGTAQQHRAINVAMKRIILSASVAVLTTLSVGALAQVAAPQGWTIGPVISGKNYSVNMPLQPTAVRDGFAIDFPYPNKRAGHIHYTTFHHGSLAGKREIVMRYRIDAAPGTRFVPQEKPDREAKLSLYFQRRGDNWGAQGNYKFYRWYAPDAKMKTIAPGEYEIRVPLDPRLDWKSVYHFESSEHPGMFKAAMAQADEVGFVMGDYRLRGHGVFATRPARITVTQFTVR